MPEGYRVVFGGQFEEAARSLRNLGFLAVAILFGSEPGNGIQSPMAEVILGGLLSW